MRVRRRARFLPEPGAHLNDLAAALPFLLPKAIVWAEGEADRALREGEPLSPERRIFAEAAGVRRSERIRLLVTDALPEPDDPALSAAARQAGLLGPGMIGLTLGYAVFIRRGRVSRRTLSHELRHVHQYEAAGGIAAFLPLYFAQIVEVGYGAAPLEADARAHETD